MKLHCVSVEEEKETTFRTVKLKFLNIYLIETVPVWEVTFKDKISLCPKKSLPAEKLSLIFYGINTMALILL